MRGSKERAALHQSRGVRKLRASTGAYLAAWAPPGRIGGDGKAGVRERTTSIAPRGRFAAIRKNYLNKKIASRCGQTA
ncbi:hypothetical protein RNT89_13140, partial [Staphylococcus pseudintermedius]